MEINVKVRIDRTKVASMAEFAANAEASGLKIRHKFDELGLVTGSIADNRLEILRRVVGVKKVVAEDELCAQ